MVMRSGDMVDAQRGYIGLTDPDWYAYLSAHPRVDEVNFWQPHGGRAFRAIQPGEPFFFKLRAPLKAIAGFGFFERFESLPAWLAWECFSEMNGAPDFETMVDRIARLRGDVDSKTGDFQIGCVMVTAPVFFARDEWVTPPSDWAKTGIQQGKTYPLDAGEGNRVFRDCLERASHGNHYWNVDLVAEDSSRYGQPSLVRPRLGQGLFSLAVRDAYRGACAVTGEHSGPVLEAAHIVPYGRGGEHRVDNGILLRSDLHRLYDRGYVTVSPDFEFLVGESLRADFNNGRSYYSLSGSRIAVPDTEAWRPSRERLEWHQDQVFRG
ncbi:MAG: HNH endonuclease [Coriobacteriia bacterium]